MKPGNIYSQANPIRRRNARHNNERSPPAASVPCPETQKMNELPSHPLAQKLGAVYANRNAAAAELRATLEDGAAGRGKALGRPIPIRTGR
jgi:hypothetical protein